MQGDKLIESVRHSAEHSEISCFADSEFAETM